jgi:ribosomal protein S18 acetylase RimI-like enzyme
MEVRAARFPEELHLVRALFREYADGLGIDLCFQGFEEELAGLPGGYSPPGGGLWLARDGDDLAGCAALRPIDAATAEMKRLYVRPAFRGRGLGRRLAEHVLGTAASAGYQRVCLDTLPSMTDAIRLYRALGFNPIEPYCHNPVCGAMFFGREIGPHGGRADDRS